ncbi:MAG: putative toxin-antitoxin system toxin component, PIN family [Sphingobacteriales bacterium]|jgi:putative PIN family toxin of toxin-antitoxin system|nr:putative toxin-antitoxin system toxin component, PIN family [Sphingobacteriales bacterium]
MLIVLDTNVLLIALPKTSPYRPIFDALREGTLSLAVSNEILFEYTEIIARQLNSSIADNLLRLLLNLPTLKLINVYFKWQLITADPDDNKFTDTAIAAQADYLVTNDRHFQVAKNIPFPIVNIVTADEFLALLNS